MKRFLTAIALSLLACGCARGTFTQTPALSGPRGLPAKATALPYTLAVWEEVRLEGAPAFKVGGPPRYAEALATELTERGLFRQVLGTPWRPASGDVFLKITDDAVIDPHATGNEIKIWTTVIFVGLPTPFLFYKTDLHSHLTLASEPADDLADAPPLQIELRGTTSVEGIFTAFFGANDVRHQLAGRHAQLMVQQLADAIESHREWFEKTGASLPPAPAN